MNHRLAIQSSILFALGVMVIFVSWWSTIEHMATLIWTVDVFAHGQLVPFISLALIWTRRDGLSRSLAFYFPGAIIIAASVLLWALGQFLEAALLTHIALISAIQGLTLLCFGKLVFKRLLFPLLFLYLAIPFGYSAIQPLQFITAELVIKLLGMLGVPYKADGVLIELSSGLYEVAQACAGVKFLFTSLVTGILLANLVFESWRRRAMIVVVSLIMPVAANVVRVLTILLIAEATDQSFAKDVDHIVYGWVFLSIVLFMLISFAYWVSDKPIEALTSAEEPDHSSIQVPYTLNTQKLAGIILAFSFLGLSPILISDDQPVSIVDNQILAQPFFNTAPDGYRLLEQTARLPKPFFSNADRVQFSLLRKSANIYSVHVASFEELGAGQRLYQAGHSVASSQWQPVAGRSRSIETRCGFAVSEQWLSRNGQIVISWEAKFAGTQIIESAIQEKLIMLRSRFGNASQSGHIIIVSSEIFTVNDGEEGLEKLRVSLNDLLEISLQTAFSQGNSPCAA